MAAVVTEPVVVDVLDSHGRVATRQRLNLSADRRSFTVGRGVAADVMVDDPYLAVLHVAIEVTAEGLIAVTDLGSVNGVIVNRERHRGAQGLVLTDGHLQIGRTHLRVHTSHQALAEERPDHAFDHAASRAAVRVASLGALGCAAFICYFGWLGASRDTATLIVTSLIMSMAAAGVWIAFWALLTRVMKGESRWVMHAAVLFGASAALLAIDWLLDVARFAFALPQWPMRDVLLLIVTVAVALYLHLTQVWTMKTRTAVLFAGLLPLMGLGTVNWVQARNQARDVNYIGVREQIFPPALRLREGEAVDQYFNDAADLQARADKKRKAMPSDDTGDEE